MHSMLKPNYNPFETRIDELLVNAVGMDAYQADRECESQKIACVPTAGRCLLGQG